MRGELYLFVATILAAIGWIASKMVIQDVPGDAFIATRFLLASLILLPFCYKAIIKLGLKRIAASCGVGLFLAVSLQVWIYALSISDGLSEGAFIMALAMIIAPMTAWILFRSRPNRAFWFALPISILGMGLLTLGNGWHVEKSQLLFLLASALLSVHFVLNKRVSASVKPLVTITLQLFTVGAAGTIFALLSGTAEFEITNQTIFWFTVSTLVATSIRYLLQTMGQFTVKIETASLLMILEPVWTMIMSFTMLGEQLDVKKVLGGGVILLSLFVYVRFAQIQKMLGFRA
ncbi:DMT family transporter [Vibrio tapetis]|uniref:EamA domain-containing protein n=1 Tax=Vibrio tapetis subsp. tapetis TaxID=1671868 RepID=A0A2N8ZII5_9VIBR|nr:DMT family transporter [Vibrio tapetis]SON51722.1 conserved membrane protein of unknown function [Vibrio tapetis subsp. tapetis]